MKTHQLYAVRKAEIAGEIVEVTVELLGNYSSEQEAREAAKSFDGPSVVKYVGGVQQPLPMSQPK